MPDVLSSADCYPDFAALTFHPLIQYLGRRSAVPAFAIFIVFFCLLLLIAETRFSSKWAAFLVMSACFVGLSYSSLDMFVAACLLLLAGVFVRNVRTQALLGLAGLVAAIPFIVIQGGFFTASLFNTPLPEAMSFFAWELREPTLVGFFKPPNLGGIPLSDPFALKVLAVDFPWFVLSLPLALVCIAKRKRFASCSWVIILIGISLAMIVAPFFVFFAFSPWDIHRLFFWPMLSSAILTPCVLDCFIKSRTLKLTAAAILLSVSCVSALVRPSLHVPTEDDTAKLRASLSFDPQKDHTWVASVGAHDLLFMNGCRVLAPPFGTAGPAYFSYPPFLLEAVTQNRLLALDAVGATMALVTSDDLAFLMKNYRGSAKILGRLEVVSNNGRRDFFVVRLASALQPR